MGLLSDSWIIVLSLGIATLVALIVWTRHGGTIWRNIGILCGLLTLLVAAADILNVSDREVVAARLEALTKSFEAKDPNTLVFVSAQSPELRGIIDMGMKAVTVRDVRLSDLDVRFTSDNTRAIVHFRASGDMDVAGFGNVGRQPAKFEAVWIREDGLWKLFRVVRKNPINDSPIELMRPSAS